MSQPLSHDVKIETRLYDAANGVTVIRVSYVDHGTDKRRTVKGVAFCAPEDRPNQSKREGTFHAFTHALREAPAGVAHEAFLALLRGGYLQESAELHWNGVFYEVR